VKARRGSATAATNPSRAACVDMRRGKSTAQHVRGAEALSTGAPQHREDGREASRGRERCRPFSACAQNSGGVTEKPLWSGGFDRIYRLAQFCTCLWPRAGRWTFGQEAEQSPGTRVRSRGMDIPEARTPDPQGAASRTTTGSRRLNRRTPPPRGTQLKATTERAFLVSSALQRSTPKRLVHLARRAVGVSPYQTMAASRVKNPSTPLVSPTHAGAIDSSPLSPGGPPPEPCRYGLQGRR
jgi:hypothetical protein